MIENIVIWLLAFVFAYAGARLGVRHEKPKKAPARLKVVNSRDDLSVQVREIVRKEMTQFKILASPRLRERG